MNYEKLIAESNLAFAGGNFDKALEDAILSIKECSTKSDGFICAGKACMSMERTEDAVKYFKSALK